MEVNTDMKKVTLVVYLDATLTHKGQELSFHKFPRDVSLRDK